VTESGQGVCKASKRRRKESGDGVRRGGIMVHGENNRAGVNEGHGHKDWKRGEGAGGNRLNRR
jgi:hypothetical protein